VINSFANKETEKVWKGKFSTKLPNEIQRIARRKLRMVNNSVTINDLRIPPANQLEKLTGNLKGFYSIRINRQWRVTFKWKGQNAEQVKIEDYHG
jgi:proteic killer suppression protein